MSQFIWITGASGFSARHLATHLRRVDPSSRLIGLGRQPDHNPVFDAWHPVDVTDASALKLAVLTDPPDRVYHLAGAVHPAGEEALWFANVAGTRLLIEAIAGAAATRVKVLISSSAAVYRATPNQVNEQAAAGGANAYGRSKWAQEQIALASGIEFGVEVVIARAFNLLGPGLPERLLAGGVVAQCRSAPDGRIETGDLSAYRDFVDIRDAVSAYCLLMDRGPDQQVYNVASGQAVQVRSMVGMLAELAGGLELIESSRPEAHSVDRSWGDVSKLKSLGWSPTFSLQQSLDDMLEAAAVSL
jgi:nucleoside-diphosphate-sugar epimerase